MAMHHHLLPFVEPDWGKRIDVRMVHERPDVSMVANSARLQSWLSTNSFSMVLHGHRHQFHSREDVLWRGDQASGRRLLIVGAGSAGVESHEVGRVEPLSVNTIDAHELTSMSWAVGITHRPISTKEALPLLEAGTSRWSDVGPPGVTSPVSIVATNMAAAHQAIYRQTAGKVVRNFVSVVETAQYCHPPTTAIGERQATADEVHHSFVALHPEWRAEHGWDDPVWIDNFLSRLGESYRIQHGPRMFAPPRGDFGPSIDQRPIRCALQALERSDTRGYLGLYDPARDLGLRRDPLPGLVGVQFIPSRGRAVLDLVATFRNLELSFWWTVNMLEMIRIQEWACHRVPGGRYSPGTITFFAAVAEWREDPRPMFISSIDQMPMNQMVELAANVAAGGGTSKIILLGKLKEKLEHTTGINIQYQGLENLHAALSGMSAVTPVPAVDVTLLSDFLARIDSAVDCLKSAVDTPAYRDDLVVKSRNALKSAIGILERTLTSSTQPQPGQ